MRWAASLTDISPFIQEALKDLLGRTIQDMLEAELDQQINAREEAEPEYSDSRNGYKPKTLRSSMGEIPIQVPQDRNSDFEPRVVPKYKKSISEIEGKIIAMYARGMSVTQVSEQIQDIYGFEVSEGMVTAITKIFLAGHIQKINVGAHVLVKRGLASFGQGFADTASSVI